MTDKKEKTSNLYLDLDLPVPTIPLPSGTDLPFDEFFKLCEKELPNTNKTRMPKPDKFKGMERFEFK